MKGFTTLALLTFSTAATAHPGHEAVFDGLLHFFSVPHTAIPASVLIILLIVSSLTRRRSR